MTLKRRRDEKNIGWAERGRREGERERWGPKHFMFLPPLSSLPLCLYPLSLSSSQGWSFYPFSQSQAPFRGLFGEGERERKASTEKGNLEEVQKAREIANKNCPQWHMYKTEVITNEMKPSTPEAIEVEQSSRRSQHRGRSSPNSRLVFLIHARARARMEWQEMGRRSRAGRGR